MASELKMISDIYHKINISHENNSYYEIQQFQPGTYSCFEMNHNNQTNWVLKRIYFISPYRL